MLKELSFETIAEGHHVYCLEGGDYGYGVVSCMKQPERA
jgi:hypothetical protein